MNYISISIDESTDVENKSQMIIRITGFDKKSHL